MAKVTTTSNKHFIVKKQEKEDKKKLEASTELTNQKGGTKSSQKEQPVRADIEEEDVEESYYR